jgi:hypothetical protein
MISTHCKRPHTKINTFDCTFCPHINNTLWWCYFIRNTITTLCCVVIVFLIYLNWYELDDVMVREWLHTYIFEFDIRSERWLIDVLLISDIIFLRCLWARTRSTIFFLFFLLGYAYNNFCHFSAFDFVILKTENK